MKGLYVFVCEGVLGCNNGYFVFRDKYVGGSYWSDLYILIFYGY